MSDQVPPLRVVRHDSELGRWELVLRDPQPRLAAYVRGYVGTESHIDFLRERHLPSGDVALIVNFGAPHRVIDPEHPTRITEQRGAWITGLHDRYLLTDAVGARHFMVVRLTPIGAYRFLGVPMAALTNRSIDLEDLIGPAARRIAARLQDTASWQARFAICDDVIGERAAVTRPAPTAVAWAWRQLDHTTGSIAIGRLGAELGWSRKHLIAQFRRCIGLPPKALARVLRFNAVVRHLERPRGVGWAALAQDCGYYDQSHFIRDFRIFAGSTPREFLARLLPDSASRVRD